MSAKHKAMGTLLALALTPPLTGCAPAFTDYYYISLVEVEGIEVGATGVADYPASLFHDPMPIKYRLERGSYALEFELDMSAFQPTVWVGGKTYEGDDLRVVGVETHQCGSWSHLPYRTQGKLDEFYWSPITWTEPPCLPAPLSDAGPHAMVFSVVGPGGEVLGEERIPFEVVRNGTVVYWDAV